VRATVKDFRLYKKDAEADIRWYRRILAATDADPLPIPE